MQAQELDTRGEVVVAQLLQGCHAERVVWPALIRTRSSSTG